jgi:hypothetical protein
MFVIVDVAVSNEVAVTVVVETPALVLIVERASADCAYTTSNAAMGSNLMMKRMPDNRVP